jgi:hypothetical protein
MAQFISYAVGCMFGRYSLDKPGLILATQGETLEDYFRIVNSDLGLENSEQGLGDEDEETNLTNHNSLITTHQSNAFLPDDDNIIPVLDQEWFEDDITGRFYKFLEAAFGRENFDKNLAFVEEALGKSVRKYFISDFYKDHVRRYKKRPIYWMFSSPGGAFNVLIYMHRYTPDTVSNILNGYLREYIEKLNTRVEHLKQIEIHGSPTERNKAVKEREKIHKMLLELQEYEREVLYPLATERIPIDLDDGVLVNYNKFGKAIKQVTGLNDAKTKKKVKGFDWIDNTQIR